jgi:hypothetical protein
MLATLGRMSPMTRSFTYAAALTAVLVGGATKSAKAQVIVAIDPTADKHVISPNIYGVELATPAHFAGGVSATRWGGVTASRYNYLLDVTNLGVEFYFENVPGCWSAAAAFCATPPADPKTQSGANLFLAGAGSASATAMLTVPTIGWVAKAAKYAHPFDCGCPRSAVAVQDAFDPYDPNCGNGKSGGANVSCPAATTTSTAADPSFLKAWAAYLVSRQGASNGARIYALDHEPALWSTFHRDVHPSRVTYDELWQRTQDYAVALTDADPTAPIAGPAEWGWLNYFCSDADDVTLGCSPDSADRKAHGGTELVAWLLDKAAAYETAHGRRILHYLDLHYYAAGGTPPQNTRSLWDPGYVDPSWINEKIRLIPRMREWVTTHYPGTKLAIGNYDFEHHNEVAGALAYVEALGIFGRESLDFAAAAGLSPTDAAFGAFKLFRNYDGSGAKFESTSVRATVSDASLRAYAAVGSSRMTVVLVNEASSAASVEVQVGAFVPTGAARLFTGNGLVLTKKADPAVTGGKVIVNLASSSFALLELAGSMPTPGDAGPDVGVDASSDAAPDASADALAEAAVDGGNEASPDGSPDDAGTVDATVDATSDATIDASSDTTIDASSDVGSVADADPSGGGNESSGCGCATPKHGETDAAGLLVAAAAVTWVTTRRRNRRR